jgi:hypothetical protein
VLAISNPYSSVVREHIVDYFADGAVGVYDGMSGQGVTAHYYHRTLEEYLDAFLDVGLRLAKPVDVPEPKRRGHRWLLPAHSYQPAVRPYI